jgi:hypothetical protein
MLSRGRPARLSGLDWEGEVTKRRASYLIQSDFERLEDWGKLVRRVFNGDFPYLVGSALTKSDYRDVDLRVIVDDETFDALYGDLVRVRLLNRAISIWGQQETGLPIDFQIQRMTEANAEFGGMERNPMGGRDWERIPTQGVPKIPPPRQTVGEALT